MNIKKFNFLEQLNFSLADKVNNDSVHILSQIKLATEMKAKLHD